MTAGYTTARTVGMEHARETWALAARELLGSTAATYHATITQLEVAEFVQERALIRTDQQARSWLGPVLSLVAQECARRAEPNLASLVVDASGHMGAAYAGAVELVEGTRPEDPDQHAAVQRLECYRAWGAELPPGGGEPALPPQAQRKRARAVAATRSTRQSKGPRSAAEKVTEATATTTAAAPPVCPVHFIQLPSSGVCDLCE